LFTLFILDSGPYIIYQQFIQLKSHSKSDSNLWLSQQHFALIWSSTLAPFGPAAAVNVTNLQERESEREQV